MTLARLALAAGLALAAAPALAQSAVDVRFAPGTFGTMVTGSVTGSDYLDLRLGASAGQEIFAELTATGSTGNGTIMFNIMPPGSTWETIFLGSNEGNSTVTPLPVDGVYTIRIYQMGNDRDTGATTDFALDLSIQ